MNDVNNVTEKKVYHKRNVFLLVFGFGINMLSFCGAQQFVSTYLPKSIGLTSLVLVYFFFALSSLTVAPVLVSKYGCKLWLVVSTVFFGIYVYTLTLTTHIFLFMASIGLGAVSGLIWIAGYTYLVRASKEEELGANSGLFYSIYGLGACIGIFVLGMLTTPETFRPYFWADGAIVIISIILFMMLENIKSDSVEKKSILQKVSATIKTTKSPTALKASTTAFIAYALFGLAVAQVPIQLKNIGLTNYISGTAIFFLLPAFFSQKSGRLSDKFGRRAMVLTAYILGIIGAMILAISDNKYLLFGGLLSMTMAFTILQPCFTALQSDIASEDKVENISGLFLVIRNLGIISVLAGANFTSIENLYYIVIGVIMASFLMIMGFPKLNSYEDRCLVRQKVDKEID